jgi:choline dehydrogenase-like flavoprotein
MKRLLGMEKGKSDGALSDIGHILTDLDDIAAAFYRKYVRRRHGPFDAMRLFLHSEQLPNPESRIRIGAERDGVGLPKTVVDWRLTAADKQSLRDTLTLLGQEVGRAGFARLRIDLPPGDDAWPEDIRGNEHHMGTTRMSDDPKTGVVDANCRVHGTDNLYVAGSSVFPTGGAANPTLTIVALALRLADHLKSKTL